MSAPAQQSLVWAGAFVQSFDNVLSPTCVADQISKNISPPKVPAQPPSCPTPFEPGCRNNWHIHHKGGQILLCTAGRGYYQEWGKEAQELHPGDVVNIPPEVKHWHGAAKDSWFAHLAVEVPAEGASNEWLEVVNEEDYEKLK